MRVDTDVEVCSQLAGYVREFVREAVRNAVRHSRPTRIDVRAAASSDHVHVDVLNDGAGQRATAPPGVGLRLLEAAAERHHGRVQRGDCDNDGWRLEVLLPTRPRRRFKP